MWFLLLSHTHTSHLFNNPPPPPPKKIKNRYTKKQPTNFFITPFKTKIKKKKEVKNRPITQFGMTKKLTPKSQAKMKTPYP